MEYVKSDMAEQKTFASLMESTVYPGLEHPNLQPRKHVQLSGAEGGSMSFGLLTLDSIRF